MKWSLKVALRYLLAKKSTNAINIITAIAILGISVGAAALVLVLSVFNGFEDLITSMYSNFDPEIRITASEGKVFKVDSSLIAKVEALEEVELVSQTLEEVAFFESEGNKEFGVLKGVDQYYKGVTHLDSSLYEGNFILEDGELSYGILGIGMSIKLEVAIPVDPAMVAPPIAVYMPKRRQVGLFDEKFRRRYLFPGASFTVQQDYDSKYVIASLDFVRELMGYRNEVSALELKLKAGVDTKRLIKTLGKELGEEYEIKDRYQQQEAFLKLMQMEKWLSFAIVGLMMILVAFNIIGALWMIVLEKKKDIAILKSMGALDKSIVNIFLNEGLLISIIGIFAGFGLALFLYGLQKQFGLIAMPGSFVVDAYPISLRAFDFLIVAITVIATGLLASILPALRAKRIDSIIREE